MRILFAWMDAAGAHEVAMEVPEGATLRQVIDAAAVVHALPVPATVGIWGKVRPRDQLVREGDRVELYAALQADPKDARRVRADRARTTRKM